MADKKKQHSKSNGVVVSDVENGEIDEVQEDEITSAEVEERPTRSTRSESGKRRAKRLQDPAALGSKPNVKTYIILKGEEYASVTPHNKRAVNRSSAKAVVELASLAKKDNRRARLIAEIAVIVAAACKQRTVDIEHIITSRNIIELVSKDLMNHSL